MNAERIAAIAAEYRTAKQRMDEVQLRLTRAVQQGKLDGMRRVDIQKAMDHLWSPAWLDTVLQRAHADDTADEASR